jgi:hypothetical protein
MNPRRIEDLIDDLRPVRQPSVPAYLLRIAAAFALAALFVVTAIRARPDLAQAVATAPFWFKQTIIALPLLIGAMGVWRLARPTGRLRSGMQRFLSFTAAAILSALALLEVSSAQPGAEVRAAGVAGLHCLFFGTLSSLPMLAIGLRWLRTMAPTQLGAASLSLGLLSGGVGLSAYALHCPYESAGYIALWYGLTVALVAAGARLWLPRRLAW